MAETSVVIPCYNAAPFLDEALSSVFAQTMSPAEVIVVDDGSTDATARIAERRGVRVIRLPQNGGPAVARNVGLRAARGELVAWFDADDVWEAEHLATVVPLLDRFPQAVLAFSLVRMFGREAGAWPALLPAEMPIDAEEPCLRRCILPQNAVVVRRAEVLAAGGYDERLRVAEDYDLWLRLSRRHPFVCTHTITCNWRRHGAQTSADMQQYWVGEYESRQRYRARVAAEATAAVLARIDARMQDVWREHLASAWHARDQRNFDFHLAMAPAVPGSGPLLPRYRFIRALLPAARTWDACPAWMKTRVRVLRGRPRQAPRRSAEE